MDPGTLAGIVLTLVAVVASMIMEGGSPTALLLLPPILLVFGGTFGAAMATGLMKAATSIVALLKRALLGKVAPSDEVIGLLVELAERARREGLLALEEAGQHVDDPFLKKGLELAVDGTDPEELREILEAEIEAKREADKASAKLFQDMGGYAPTIGIIGTVVGLVHVLENLSSPEKLGHLIAGAFVATLWGVLSANALWLPISGKLKRMSGIECAQMELALEGILSIQAGSNPRVIRQKLLSFLPPLQRAAAEQKAAA